MARTEPPRALFDIVPTDVLDYLARGLPSEAKRKNTIVSFKKFFKFMGGYRADGLGDSVRDTRDAAGDVRRG